MFIVMKITDDPLRNSRGIVLMSALTILSVLLALGIGIRVMLKNDYQVVANLRGGTEAFYYSAAGIEWSKNEIASTAAFPPVPANQMKSFAAGGFRCFIPTPRFGRTADSPSRGPFCRHDRSVIPCARSSVDENLRSCRRRVGAPGRRRAHEYQRQRPVYFRNGPRSGKRQSSDRGQITERYLSV